MECEECEFVGKRGTGEGEFRDITGIAADSFGTTLVVDSRNHRIQLYNKSTLLGVMQVLFLDELVFFHIHHNHPSLQP